MALPKSKGYAARKARAARKLQRTSIEDDKCIRRHLRQARAHAVELANGNSDALEGMKVELEDAVDSGLSPNVITIGGNMVAKIDAILDRPPSQNHAIGLLLNAADIVDNFDTGLSAKIRANASRIENGNNEEVNRWRDISTPVREIVRT